eukprot:scaffold16843_cov51-Cyclotella_meneghiniana.AAC.1
MHATSLASISSRGEVRGDSIPFLLAARSRLRLSGTFPSCQRRIHYRIDRLLSHSPTVGLYSI